MKPNDDRYWTKEAILQRLLTPRPKPAPKPNPSAPTAEQKAPLGLAEQRARARWCKPLPAVIADALASNRGLLERLKPGVYGPDMKHKEQYQVLFDGLYQATQEQIEALEVFARVDWSECCGGHCWNWLKIKNKPKAMGTVRASL